eukprot:TRINITY_DN9104_c0_g1_i1.p1 TRINITY_DN9104_c0_g1~~TRINITY_DN9104_c0_g1_i1.p1  ORF type:complete len:161 (-),score=39.45 TRINITY_DN9104_c0_g1_i1:53-535(-)
MELTAPDGAKLTEREKKLVELTRKIMVVPTTSWVMFSHGTLVFFYASRVRPTDDLAAQAKSIMKQYGPVVVGSSAGDFAVIPFDYKWEKLSLGWGVNYENHHLDIMTVILVDDLVEDAASLKDGERPSGLNDVMIGMLGRGRRDKDSETLRIIHIEDKRS